MTPWLILLLLGMAADHYTSYRAHKLGLEGSLPAEHPYKAAPP